MATMGACRISSAELTENRTLFVDLFAIVEVCRTAFTVVAVVRAVAVLRHVLGFSPSRCGLSIG